MAWILGLVALYVLAMLAISWISLHPPRLPLYLSPGAFGAPQEEVAFEAGGVPLRGWWMESRAERPKVAVVFAHGYMMSRCELAPEAFYLWQRGAACLLLDQRRHGRSGGGKSTLGYLERHDVAAAVRFARARAPEAKILLVGSSMGAAASALAVAEDPSLVDALVLDSCYGRLSGAILGWWRFLGGKFLAALLAPTAFLAIPMAGFNPFRVDIGRHLCRLEGVPVLLFHGTKDDLALPSEARRNFEALPGPKEIVWFEGCGHSEGRWLFPDRYHEALVGFMERAGLGGWG